MRFRPGVLGDPGTPKTCGGIVKTLKQWIRATAEDRWAETEGKGRCWKSRILQKAKSLEKQQSFYIVDVRSGAKRDIKDVMNEQNGCLEEVLHHVNPNISTVF